MDASVAQQGGCANCARLEKLLEAALARVGELEQLVRDLQGQVRELKAKLDQNSSNSHQPPSSDPPWHKPPPRKPTGRKPGGQAGHQGHSRKRLPPQRVDRYVHHVPQVCQYCHACLPREAGPQDPPPRWHQVAELPKIAAIITEHQSHARTCLHCGRLTRAIIPWSVRRHVLGQRLASVMSYLAGRCHNGRRTVREIVLDLFGVPLSLGSVCRYEAQMSEALAAAHEQAVRSVREAPVRHVDETGWNRAGKTCWLWIAATKRLSCFVLHAARNWPALCALLGTDAGKGIICSDRWHAYSRIGLRRRQLCWAHLKRDFQKWSDKGGATRLLGEDGLELCGKVFGFWRDFRQRTLTRRQLQRRLGPLRRRLKQVLEWNKACGQASAAKFCRNLLSVESALWTFCRVPGMEPTNNAAERALRPAVLWRKNCFGSYSDAGLRFTERILTVTQSLRQQGASALPWLEQTLAAYRNASPPPKLP